MHVNARGLRATIISMMFFMLVPSFVQAQVIISEIMYDIEGADTGREWIEVENIGSETVDLSVWKLFEADTNHRITEVGTKVLSPGGFAIIADNVGKFKVDNPSFSGLLFESAFSLSNEGETLIIRNQSGVDSDSVAYMPALGAAGNGTTLQKSGSGWIAALPTVGSATVVTESSEPPQEEKAKDENTKDLEVSLQAAEKTAVHSSHSSQEVANISFDAPELVVTSGRTRLGFVGVPLSFEAKVKSSKNIPIGSGVSNSWSMGDGSRESGQFISHTYDFPGDYIVILNSALGGAEAVSKVKVRIIEPNISLEAGEGYVSVENKDINELNLGGWIIASQPGRFVIPEDTIIAARSMVKFSENVTRLKSGEGVIRILDPRGKKLSMAQKYPHLSQIHDPVIILPNGLSVDDLRNRIEIALREPALAESKSKNIDVALIPEPAAGLDTKDIQEEYALTGQEMAASVIYTASDNGQSPFWKALKNAVLK